MKMVHGRNFVNLDNFVPSVGPVHGRRPHPFIR